MTNTANTNDTNGIVGMSTRIGRFVARVVSGIVDSEPCISFETADGRAFGDIRLSTAQSPVVVDLYESAARMLNLPLCFNTDDYCLDKSEIGELKAWANGLAGAVA